MSLLVLEAGLFTLPVDFGRPGYRALGVPAGGAADRLALAIGNALVGNDSQCVALEMTLRGPTLKAIDRTSAVVVGAHFEIRTDHRGTIEPASTFLLEPGDTLRIGGALSGCRSYLCVAGGFEFPLVLGGRGAFKPLGNGERLVCQAFPDSNQSSRVGRGIMRHHWPKTPETAVLRVLPGPQADWFLDNTFHTTTYQILPASDRMGVRLDGPVLARKPGELPSEPAAPGGIQVTNEGRPVILGVEAQTIGGYPKVAHVIRADLDAVGQLRPGEHVRFQQVSLEEAEAAGMQRDRELRLWKQRIELRLT